MDSDQIRYGIAETAESVIANWVDTAYKTVLAGLGADDEAGRKAVEQMRHVHLAEPWIPASRIAQQLRLI